MEPPRPVQSPFAMAAPRRFDLEDILNRPGTY
ncbi:MAG: hypothetical protein QOC64_838, partial [Solirubrobacteraceae bacterium]|nr:hypothetical protein [Solirubrobacteraceae bacterium]